MSKFNTKPLSEVAHMLPSEGHKLEPEHLQQLRELSTGIWGGWGQTKLVERGNREVREQESFDSARKTLSVAKQWDSFAHQRCDLPAGQTRVGPTSLCPTYLSPWPAASSGQAPVQL